MLIVENGGFPDGGPSTISSFIELTVNSFGRDWTIQMLIQLRSQFGGSSPMLSSHNTFSARRSLSVSLDVRPELLRLLEAFPCFLITFMVLDMVDLEISSSSAVSCHTSSTICNFSHSVSSHILT